MLFCPETESEYLYYPILMAAISEGGTGEISESRPELDSRFPTSKFDLINMWKQGLGIEVEHTSVGISHSVRISGGSGPKMTPYWLCR